MYLISLCNLERYPEETYSPVILKFIEPRWRVVNVAGTCVSSELDNHSYGGGVSEQLPCVGLFSGPVSKSPLHLGVAIAIYFHYGVI